MSGGCCGRECLGEGAGEGGGTAHGKDVQVGAVVENVRGVLW